MGRRFLISAAIAAATFGVAAGPALAAPTAPSMSHGQKLTRSQRTLVNSRMKAAEKASATGSPMTPGTAYVLKHGGLAECTVPEHGGTYENFFTRNTTNYIEFNGLVVVGSCTADLMNKQISATAQDKPGPKTMITIPAVYRTYSEACEILYQGHALIGDAESIVYPNGIFSETCIVPV